MRGSTPRNLAVGLTALALVATGCGGDDNAAGGKTGGELRAFATEPAFLLPSAGDDEPSINVIRQMYRGLVRYDVKSGEPVNDLAESIESTDNKVWKIKIKDGHKFTNGEPVNSDAFIRSWNFAAYSPNAQNNAYFMKRIAGIDDVTAEDPDGDGPKKAGEPKAKELSGLKKVSDLEFEVTLKEPFSGFTAVVGYSGFFPMADACLKDHKKCNEEPIANGPYKIEGKWLRNQSVTLVRNDAWIGEKGKADKIVFKIFADVNAGYAAFQAGELDVMYTIPPERYTDAKGKYGSGLYEAPGNSFTYVGLPLYNKNFEDVRIRKAISMAVDRSAIVKAAFDDRFVPATGLVSPTFPGYRADVCKACKLDVVEAKKLLGEAGGWKGGKLTLWANAGAAHEKWLQIFGDQVKQNLGIDYELKVNLQFPEYLATADSNKFTGPFRLGWGPDYPVIETYLKPLYGTGGSSNNTTYSNPKFDDLIKQGDAAKDVDAAIPFYNQAEDVVLEDMPVIPLWFNKEAVLYGDKISEDGFAYNPISDVDYGQVSFK
ncbi:ABC transporter substrate-binding protein [Pilimelia columellifera]|uniref:ABC transporter substrate-binding protein n=1 Tax=Pilimelia columellifera subsp. columellifera TaxID=706583 RepID=A0ABN3NH38_9ACTN